MQDLELKKAAVIAEYLTKNVSFRELGQKHGVRYSSIHAWVKEFKSKKVPVGKKVKTKKQEPVDGLDEPSVDIKQLQKELEMARLENKLLNAIINIAEERFDIEIRKKPGAKRLKK
jgi:transposase-like protein